MFGYHDSPTCTFDLWAPTLERSAPENRAFSAYCAHTQEIMDVVELIADGATDIELDDDFDDNDLKELHRLLRERGIDGQLTLS